ncbi:MAG TPA: methyltransferase domain-containing protein [Gemmatimonadaceae bacterium]|jgi:SAM-dependent methyltransferase
MKKAAFGEQRLALPEVSSAERLLFQVLGVVDPAHYLHSRYFRRSLEKWKDLAPRAILDAGCGRGDYSFFLARTFPEAQVYGVDIDAARVERNRRMSATLGLDNVTFEVADIVTARFPTTFDLIVSIDVLEHIPEQEKALRNLASQLTPEGRVFYHVPTRRERPVPFSGALGGFHEWAEKEHTAEDRSAAQFVDVLGRNGYHVTRYQRTFGYYTGELATSLFNMPYQNTLRNKMFQAMLSPICRVLALADALGIERTRYAVAAEAQRAS